MIELLLAFIIAVISSFIITRILIIKAKQSGFIGKDMAKEGVEVPEMGGYAIICGFLIGLSFLMFFSNDNLFLFAGALSISIVFLIGLFDDLFDIPQLPKAFIPIIASVPLILLHLTSANTITIPIINLTLNGIIPFFDLIYIFICIPIGYAVATNLTNMLAGWNGNETGMGIIMFLAMFIIGFSHSNIIIIAIAIPMLGALIGFFILNKYPSKIFPNDCGTFIIGGALSVIAILGNLEIALVILLIPYMIDFCIKLPNRMPKTFGELKDGKLYAPANKAKGLGQLIMKLTNGIEERKLTWVLIGMEVVCAIVVVAIYR